MAKQIIDPVVVFTCSCGNANEKEFIEFKGHLLAAHNLSPQQLKGQKNMLMHINGEGFHSYHYHWTLESGLEFEQFITRPKR